MSKRLAAVLVWVALLVGGAAFYIFLPNTFHSIEKRLRDFLFLVRGPIAPTGEVVIVDIDEKSLAALGQWPWERRLVAALLQRLADDGAGMIGFDMVFAEKDKTSPAYLDAKLGLGLKNPSDYDLELSEAVANTPTIAGYVFDLEEVRPGKKAPQIPAIIIEKNPGEYSSIFTAKGVLPNIDVIQDRAYSSGFFNTIPDESGMIRSVPMLMRYDDMLYPSLALEMMRIAMQKNRIIVHYGVTGAESISIGKYTIPVNRYGEMAVNYRGPKFTIRYVSAVDILEGRADPNEIAGKFVLIGTSAAGLLDLRATPFDNAIPGVEVHANVIDNILTGDFLSRPEWLDSADIALYALIMTIAFFFFLRVGALKLFLLMILFVIGIYHLLEYLIFGQGILFNTLMPFLALLASAIAAMLINYFFEARQKQMIRDTFSKKVSASVVDDLLAHPDRNIMRNREEEVTVFFSDIRGFTSISERIHSAQKLIELLNFYATPMTEIILQNRGTVDKFIGDAIMAYWNAPQPLENHADRAVASALQQLHRLEELNKVIEANYGFPIAIGIGINTDRVIVGEMGSEGRSDYTVIGDGVNLASRLEGLNKLYGTRLIVSEMTKARLMHDYVFRELDQVRVKGKSEAIRIYEVIAAGVPDSALEDELKRYRDALELYYGGEFETALERFSGLQVQYKLALYDLYRDRCRFYLENSEERRRFDGVFTAVTK